MHRGQYRAGHFAHPGGRGRFRSQGGDERGLAHLSDPRHHRDAGVDGPRAPQSSRNAPYPSPDVTETPETIDCVLINHPEWPPTGAGERSIRPVAAAIANAIFDATG